MPKAVALTPELVETPQITPKAATPARSVVTDTKKAAPKAKPIPLQVRLPRAEVKAIKVAAAEREQSISNFMLACFHAYMKAGKSAS
jgi:hypothetical protein